jgi:hypothetical protein
MSLMMEASHIEKQEMLIVSLHLRAWMCQNAVTGRHCTTLTTLGESTNPEVRTGTVHVSERALLFPSNTRMPTTLTGDSYKQITTDTTTNVQDPLPNPGCTAVRHMTAQGISPTYYISFLQCVNRRRKSRQCTVCGPKQITTLEVRWYVSPISPEQPQKAWIWNTRGVIYMYRDTCVRIRRPVRAHAHTHTHTHKAYI